MSAALRSVVAVLLATASVFAQGRGSDETRREQWQKVDEIFRAMNVHPGAIVADVGAGEGFFTTRLAKAVGPEGRVYAVDVDDRALNRLRERLEANAIRNVVVIKGAIDNPKLPEQTLDAALIVNAYHEMTAHQSMLAALGRALKPDGRLVIVEPITDAKRARARSDQARDHEIAPEFVLQDARAAGFRITGLQDPFTMRQNTAEWLITLQPGGIAAATVPAQSATSPSEPDQKEQDDPALRIPPDEFRKLASAGAITVVDVRDAESFAAGHIAGAISIPLPAIESAVEQLRKLGKPVVTYCS